MASSGGHWVKVGSGTHAGTMVFVPKPVEDSSAALYASATAAFLKKTGSIKGAYAFLDDAQAKYVNAAAAKLTSTGYGLQGGSGQGQGINAPKLKRTVSINNPAGSGYLASEHFNSIKGKTAIKIAGGSSYTGVNTGHGFSMVHNPHTGTYQVLNNQGQVIKSFESSTQALKFSQDFSDKWAAKVAPQQSSLW